MWIKIWRDSSAMTGIPHYAEYENEEDIKNLLEDFDEKKEGDGCHEIRWECVDKPSKKWLQKKLSKYIERLQNLKSEYEDLKYSLEKYIRKYSNLI